MTYKLNISDIHVRDANLQNSRDFHLAFNMELLLAKENFSARKDIDTREMLTRMLTYPDFQRTLFATIKGEEKGYTRYKFSTSGAGNIVNLSSLYVSKSERKKGLGSFLLDKVVKDARLRKCGSIYVCSVPDALEFYRHKGFDIIDKESDSKLRKMSLVL